MANLVSPGVSVTVTDESFFIPAAATTIPLLFIATADEKTQPNSLLPALGTYESNIVRTVTSQKMSGELYGIPMFHEDSQGRPLNGDATNEYGLFALNQFLGVGNLAYVIRANINLNTNLNDIRDMWDQKMDDASVVLENIVAQFINEYNTANGFIPSDPGYKLTVTDTELFPLIEQATLPIWQNSTFTSSEPDFMADWTATPLAVYPNGYDNPAVPPPFLGMMGILLDWVANNFGTVVPGQWSPSEAANTLLGAADQFKYTANFKNNTSLGANDAARRVAIVTALQASINSNQDIRADQYQYNLIVCPGYPETVDEMLNLCVDIEEEAMVIGDTPFNVSPEEVVNWAATPQRRSSRNVAYYYPHGLASETYTGKNVFIASSGIALRTLAYSDLVSDVWWAPAGTQRGIVSGVDLVGYVTGELGTATTFVDVALNQGQRDALYQYFTNINPIVFFPGRGLLVFGQKTSSPVASALDRVNVVRLVMYIKRQLRINTLPFVFEPNDQITRDNLKAVVDNFLRNIVVKRGLYDFATVCDESNNTPDRIDRNEMYIDVALKPVKAAEFIYIPIRVVSTGAQI